MVTAPSISTAEQNTFNTNFQTAVTTNSNNVAIIRRTCASSTYCQIQEMFYKRKNPTASFSPFSKLLTVWEEGTDNRFTIDFDMYSLLKDALMSLNEYAYCSFSDSTLLAFDKCGPSAAVSNNAIGSDRVSNL